MPPIAMLAGDGEEHDVGDVNWKCPVHPERTSSSKVPSRAHLNLLLSSELCYDSIKENSTSG